MQSRKTHDQRHHNDNCLIFFQNREVDNCDIIMIMNDNDNNDDNDNEMIVV